MTDLDLAVERLRALGVSRIESYAWRDLDDPDAGGSELHADEIMRRWAAAGLDVAHRTSSRSGSRSVRRHGYSVTQQGGRYDVFARVFLRQLVRRRPSSTATIEIWNGVPWLTPIWAPRRRIVWMHHVHRDMWADVLPRPLDTCGRLVETRLAPLLYRRSRFATLSDSSCDEIVHIGIPRHHITVIPPGVHERFTPDPSRRCPEPHVVVVGRLAPVKRQTLALDALATVRRAHPALQVTVVGDGPDRPLVEQWIDDHDAHGWVTMTGRVDDDRLVEAYRSAWLVVSASKAEGWGMSLTEGAACATPCVATDIPGHRGAAIDGVTGLLVEPTAQRLAEGIETLLADADRRTTLSAGALSHAGRLSWTAVAARQLDALCDAIDTSSRSRRGGSGRGVRQRSSGTT